MSPRTEPAATTQHWTRHLPDVGSGITGDYIGDPQHGTTRHVEHLTRLLAEQTTRLREQIAASEAALFKRVARDWTDAEIAQAKSQQRCRMTATTDVYGCNNCDWEGRSHLRLADTTCPMCRHSTAPLSEMEPPLPFGTTPLESQPTGLIGRQVWWWMDSACAQLATGVVLHLSLAWVHIGLQDGSVRCVRLSDISLQDLQGRPGGAA